MARDYPGNDSQNEFGQHGRLQQGRRDFFDPMNSDEGRRRDSAYGAGNSGDYSAGTQYGEGGSHTGTGYEESQLGRYYSPQRLQGGNSYGSSSSHQSDRNSSLGYSGRMSDYRGAPQRSGGWAEQGYQSQADPYGSGAGRNYSSASEYGVPSGGYGRSSMGFPRGSDYGGSSGSMGGGYFGSGGGPWSGGPYGETGQGGFTPQRNHGASNEEDYRYSRREQRRRGESDQGYGNPYER